MWLLVVAVALGTPAWAEGPTFEELKERVESLYKKQRFLEAADAAEQTLAAAERQFGKDDARVATALTDLAMFYRMAAEDAKATYEQKAPALYERALAISEGSLGPDHPSVGSIAYSLGRLYQSADRKPEAEQLYRRALRIYEKQFGGHDPRLAEILTSLAELFVSQGRYDEARPAYTQAASIYQASYGADRAAVLMAEAKLKAFMEAPANPQTKAGSQPPAVDGHADSGSGASPTSGANSAATARDSEAEAPYRWKLTAMEAALGPDHPNLTPVLTTLAKLCRDKDRYDEAETLFLRALAIDTKRRGAESDQAAADLANLAELFKAQRRCKEAVPFYERFLAIMEKGVQVERPDYLPAMRQYLECVEAGGDTRKIKAARARAKRAGVK
ncbi:MAG: tetratricopeptide repeat protein [Candidatus Omnitrophica bacterium]|nr:tetratricopeptide repeat protein [Candidatus Omnitrophota bacterium]